MQKKIHQDVFVGFILIIISIFLYIRTYDFMDEAAMFPRILIALLAIFSIFIISKGIRKTRMIRNNETIVYEGDEEELNSKILSSPFITLFIVVIYVILLNVIGFFPSTILYITFYLWHKEIKDWKVYLYVLASVNLFIYFIFVMQLHVQLPLGILFE